MIVGAIVNSHGSPIQLRYGNGDDVIVMNIIKNQNLANLTITLPDHLKFASSAPAS